MDLRSKCEPGGHLGTLIINGLTLPHSATSDPIALLWAHGLRNHVREQFNIDAACFVLYNDDSKNIVINLYLNYANQTAKQKKEHEKRFAKNFHSIVNVLRETILAFTEDECFRRYEKALGRHDRANLVKHFLATKGYRH